MGGCLQKHVNSVSVLTITYFDIDPFEEHLRWSMEMEMVEMM